VCCQLCDIAEDEMLQCIAALGHITRPPPCRTRATSSHSADVDDNEGEDESSKDATSSGSTSTKQAATSFSRGWMTSSQQEKVRALLKVLVLKKIEVFVQTQKKTVAAASSGTVAATSSHSCDGSKPQDSDLSLGALLDIDWFQKYSSTFQQLTVREYSAPVATSASAPVDLSTTEETGAEGVTEIRVGENNKKRKGVGGQVKQLKVPSKKSRGSVTNGSPSSHVAGAAGMLANHSLNMHLSYYK
jgi:hypothetical protein